MKNTEQDVLKHVPKLCNINLLLDHENEHEIFKSAQNFGFNVRRTDVHFISVYETECLVLYDNALKELYIAFKWTEDDEVSDVGAHLLTKSITVPEIGTVHSGYYKKFMTVRGDIYDKIKCYKSYKINNIYITGHSLGGALASIAYLFLANHFKEYFSKMICITTGSCRSIKKVELKNEQCYNFITSQDYITLYPLWYKHLGKTFVMNLSTKKTSSDLKFLTRFGLVVSFIAEQVKNLFTKGSFFLIPSAHKLDLYKSFIKESLSNNK